MTVLRLIGRPWKASSLFVMVLPVLFVVGLVIGYYAKAAMGGEQSAKTLYDRLGKGSVPHHYLVPMDAVYFGCIYPHPGQCLYVLII